MNRPILGEPYIEGRGRYFVTFWRRLIAALAILLLLALTTACDEASSDDTASRERARQDRLVKYEEDGCAFNVPLRYEIQCGYLTVPMNRGTTRLSTVDIHVAVFKSWGADAKDDPVVFLQGGPGFVTLDSLAFSFSSLVEPFLEHRDVIFFDQRGTGYSEPSLACYDLSYIAYDLMPDSTPEDERELYREALRDCRASLRNEGITFESFSTKEIAADLEDLRQVLGYEHWNLYGVSYGTKVALAAMRDFPDGVRTAVLDSAYPMEVNLPSDIAANISRATAAIFRACDKDEECSDEFPDLRESFLKAMDRLEESPAKIRRFDPSIAFDSSSGDEEELPERTFDDGAFVKIVNQALYASEFIPRIPQLIAAVENEDYSAASFLANLLPSEGDDFSTGLYLSVQCAEELAFTTPTKVRREFARHDATGRALTDLYIDATFEDCDIWKVAAAESAVNEPVTSDVPTLVLAGEFDPVTPPSYGKLVAENQRGSFFVEFPGYGHGVTTESPCAQKIMVDFIDHPRERPDVRCRERIPPIDWVPE